MSRMGWIVLFCILPMAALLEQGTPWGVWLFLALLNGVSFVLIAWDKAQAIKKGWRISEATLHTFEWLGGWPGSMMAQHLCRHKTSKWSYRWVCGAAVLTYQAAAAYALFWVKS